MKKIMKSILSVLLALVCVFSTFAVSGSAKSQKTNDVLFYVDYEYNYNGCEDEFAVSISLYAGEVKNFDFRVLAIEGFNLKRIERSDELDNYFAEHESCMDATSVKNGKVSAIFGEGFDEPCAMYYFVYERPEVDFWEIIACIRVIFDCLVDGNDQSVSAHIMYANPMNFVMFLENDIQMNCKNKKICSIGIVNMGDYPSVTYSSSDPSVAKVDEITGEIYAVKRGTAYITVTVNGDYIKEDTMKVEVKYTWWQWLIKIFLFGWIWY